MRDLKAVWESDPVAQAWAEQMRQTLKKARRTVDTATAHAAASLPAATSESLRDLYLNTAQQGIDANTPGTAGRSHNAYKLAKRMRERVDQVLYFTWTSTSSGRTTLPSRRSGWPSSKPRSAGVGAAYKD